MRVLLADGSVYRANTFRIIGGSYAFRIVRTLDALEKALEEPEAWDVILHTLYLGNWKDGELESLPALRKAWNAKKIRWGVVCTSTVSKDAKVFLSALRAAGIPGRYYPFSYQNPSQHFDMTHTLDLPSLAEVAK